MDRPPESWRCPWCGAHSSAPADVAVVCHSRKCSCGALGLGAPPRDTDEIVDDAINVFGIAAACMTPFDADRVAGLRRAGVEIAEGDRVAAPGDRPLELRILWFRRGKQEV